MKKFLFGFIALLFAVFTVNAFSSCHKDDEEIINLPAEIPNDSIRNTYTQGE